MSLPPSSPSTPNLGAAETSALALRLLSESRQATVLLEGSRPAEARILHANPAFTHLTGYAPPESVGRTLIELLQPAAKPEDWATDTSEKTTGTSFRRALTCKRQNGSTFLADVHLFALSTGATETLSWAAVINDIDSQIQLHETLWRSEILHHLLAENIRDLITVWSPGGHCLYASPSCKDLLGLPPETLFGKTYSDLLHPDEVSLLSNAFSQVSSRPKQIQHIHRLKRSDGTYLWVESVTKTRVDPSSRSPSDIVISTRDISKRHAAEQALRHVHTLLSSIYDAVPLGLAVIDPMGNVSQANTTFHSLYRQANQAMVGHAARDFLPEEHLARASATHGVPVACECRDANGTLFHAELTVIPLSPESGRLVVLTGTQERRRLEEKLEEHRRLESLGTLAGGIAHDFNNMLAIILGYASLLRETGDDPARLGHYADTIMDAARRGAEVVRQLQLFANTQTADTIPTDIHRLLDEIISTAAAKWPDNVKVRRYFDAEDAVLVVDPLQFAQAVEKLLDNARKAMPEGGTLTVRTSEIRQSVFAAGASQPESRAFLRLTVQDSGQGMDAATRSRMFDPFFAQSKGPEARGLGLAVVYGIVRAHRGMIEVESSVGHGTSVHLLMPRALAPDTEGAGGGAELTRVKRGNTILLVEDEIDLGALWNDILPNHGWRTLWAKDGEEAVRLFQDHSDEIALVFTDVGLPLLDGWQVAAAIRAERPDMPLIITSGAFGNMDRQRGITPPVFYLPKPYLHTKVLQQIKVMVPNENEE